MAALYVESSAVLAWLFDEPGADRVVAILEGAEQPAASVLTRLEVERTMARHVASGKRSEAEANRLRGRLAREMASWMMVGMREEILERAARPFPIEPLRALDAIHLATALELVKPFPEVQILTLDRRVADNARALGLDLAV